MTKLILIILLPACIINTIGLYMMSGLIKTQNDSINKLEAMVERQHDLNPKKMAANARNTAAHVSRSITINKVKFDDSGSTSKITFTDNTVNPASTYVQPGCPNLATQINKKLIVSYNTKTNRYYIGCQHTKSLNK